MGILEMFWIAWLDGWTGDHCVTMIWTATTTTGAALGVMLWLIHRHDMKKYLG